MIAGGYLLGRRNNTIDPGAEPVVGRKLLVILGGARIPIPNELAIVDRHFADYPLRGGDAATGCVAISELTAQDVPHGDIGAGTVLAEAGRQVLPGDLLIARAAGVEKVAVRRPRLRIVNVPSGTITANLIVESARGRGAEVIFAEAASRDAASIAEALDGGCDLLITVGGSGVGRTDATIVALAERGEVHAHGIALQPGRTAAIGKVGETPMVALPGAPDQAWAVWWTLAVPALDRLTGRRPQRTVTLPLARKIASHVGLAEIVLLARNDGAWMPLATGDLRLETIARADGWVLVPGGSEGFAAGAEVDAYMLRQ